MHDPASPYDGYDETDDTEEKARNVCLAKLIDHDGKKGLELRYVLNNVAGIYRQILFE